MELKPPMLNTRGAVLLCDHISRMEGGKFLLVGTYTAIRCHGPIWHQPGGLPIYVRFQVEHSGHHRLKILFIARDELPNVEPLMKIEAGIDIPSPHAPCEISFTAPGITVACPPDRYAALDDGQGVVLHYTVWAEVDDAPLASCPLDVIFLPPYGSHDHGPAPELRP